LISDHAKKQLEVRFGIKENIENEIAYRTNNSKLLSPTEVNRCGTKFKIGFTYLRYRDMILVYRNNLLTNVFYYFNPFRMIKREIKNANQRCVTT
jgi:hypothetical protein